MASAEAWTPEEFRQRLQVTADGCWEWTGPRNENGYGVATKRGRQGGAHRLAWRLFVGADPGGMQVCHHCDNPPCCNPGHLFLGDAGVNRFDCVVKGRALGSTAYLRLPPVTFRDCLDAYLLLALGASVDDVGAAFGLQWPPFVEHAARMAEFRLRVGLPIEPIPPAAVGF